jgi:hypothetical protein
MQAPDLIRIYWKRHEARDKRSSLFSRIFDDEIRNILHLRFQLFCGSIAIDLDDQDQNFLDEFDATDDDVIAETSDVIDDSGFVDVSQLSGSEMVMADGTKVYFVVAPESPEASPISAASPESPAFAASPESDESWSPESCPSSGRPRRKPTERKGGVRKAKSTIVDKKERKKHQNVEAARRYRYILMSLTS